MYNNATPYHRRLAARLAKAKEQRGNMQANKYIEIDRFLLTYESAYFAFYGVRIQVRYRKGWYYVHSGKYRHSAIQSMTESLLARVQALDSPDVTETEGEENEE